MADSLTLLGNLVGSLMSVQMPYGIAWGVLVVGCATMPILFHVIKKIF